MCTVCADSCLHELQRLVEVHHFVHHEVRCSVRSAQSATANSAPPDSCGNVLQHSTNNRILHRGTLERAQRGQRPTMHRSTVASTDRRIAHTYDDRGRP